MRSDGDLSNESMNTILGELDLEESRLEIPGSSPASREQAPPVEAQT